MSKSYKELVDIIKKLREPINGCPWDLKQNIRSLAPALLEESCECLDGVARDDSSNVAEELGDIIFTATLMSYILEQEKITTIDDILNSVNSKMISRHPHVFKDDSQKLDSSEEVLKQWDEIKVKKEGRVKKGLLDKIPSSLPSIHRAYEIQKKVEKVGFDWPSAEDIFKKIQEETEEVKAEIISNERDKLELEIGDLLFSVINLSRFLNIDPDMALNRTNNKFIHRFTKVEERMKNEKLDLKSENFKIMDEYWEQSK